MITKKQRNVLNKILDFQVKNGFSPTWRELGEILGIAHTAARQHVELMKKKGVIDYQPGKKRTIVILEGEDDSRSNKQKL